MKKLFFTILTLIALNSYCVYSQHDQHNEHNNEHLINHNHHQNHLALFLGATTNFEHETTGFSMGIDYEYRLKTMHNLLGIGLFGEYIFSESGEIITGIPLFIHPAKILKLIIAPILVSGENNHAHVNETNMGVRLGVASNYHFKKISIGPSVNLDFGKTTSLVYGIAIGVGL
ncbi:MAG: hypothetical protein GXO79_07255 [Chlorobi bacterium]|nr:hypothetical protein [Chlorobiota bacterium]